FWAGLLAREEGDRARAHSLLHAAAQQGCATDLPVWRALAAIALHADQPRDAIAYCQRALANGQDREAVLLLMAAACLRTGQRAQAHEVAAQIATLRGGSWSPVGVLHEIGG
ncbi:MAG TPA: molecular chaperone DnaJ, partial [Roseiflexaceae bacterium]|nr:molecular chaperone DnaJ [Roseiflexaceae bacterium]